MRLGWVVVACGLAGCGEGGRAEEYLDDDFPAGGCRDTEGAGTTSCDTDPTVVTEGLVSTSGATGSSACGASDECMGGHCIAPWDPATSVRGEFACEFACIGELDERRWCADDASCCDTEATCTARGYCIVDRIDGTSTGDSTSTSTVTSTSTDGTTSDSMSTSSSSSGTTGR